MQGSKVVERAPRTRTKNPERVEKALARKAADRAVKARTAQERNTRSKRRALMGCMLEAEVRYV